MAAAAVLLIHMDKNQVGIIRPNINLEGTEQIFESCNISNINFLVIDPFAMVLLWMDWCHLIHNPSAFRDIREIEIVDSIVAKVLFLLCKKSWGMNVHIHSFYKCARAEIPSASAVIGLQSNWTTRYKAETVNRTRRTCLQYWSKI